MEVFRDLGKTCTNAKPTNTNKENINLKYYLFISFAGNLNFFVQSDHSWSLKTVEFSPLQY